MMKFGMGTDTVWGSNGLACIIENNRLTTVKMWQAKSGE